MDNSSVDSDIDPMLCRRPHMITLLLIWSLGCTFATANFFLHRSDNPLGYDEGDYYEAIHRGWWLNWSDADNVPISEYVSLALDAVQGSITKADMSNFIREKNSTMFLRHEHSPVAFYPALALQPFVQNMPLHKQLRLANLLWMLLSLSLLCLVFFLYPFTLSPWIILLPASASFAMASAGYNMHIPFGLVVTAFFYCWLVHSMQPQKKGLKILTLFLLSTTLITVEYGIFIASFLFLWGIIRLIQTNRKKEFLVARGKESLWVVGFILILWPSSLLTLGIVRSYALQIYMTLFRLPDDKTRYASLFDMLYGKWNASPLELVVAAFFIGWMLYHWRLLLRYGSFFVSFCFLLVLIWFHFSFRITLWWYLFPFFAIIFSFYTPALFQLNILPKRWQYSLPAAFGVAALFFAISIFAVQIPRSDQAFRMHEIIRSTASEQITIPLSMYTQIKPYFPSKTLIRLHDTEYDTNSLDDSLTVWRRRGMVVVPRQFAVTLRQQPNDSTESYLIFDAVP